MPEKKLFNFFPLDDQVFKKTLIWVFALWIVGHVASYLYYGETTRTDLIGSTIAGFILAYFVHLILIFNNQEE